MNEIGKRWRRAAHRRGEYLNGSLAGSYYRAYVPKPLPPDPALDFDTEFVAAVERANQALGRLDGITLMLSDTQAIMVAAPHAERVGQ